MLSILFVFALLIIASFPLSWLTIPLSLFTYSALLIVCSLTIVLIYRRLGISLEIMMPSPFVIDDMKKWGLGIALIALIIGVVYLRGKFMLPQYFTLDSAVHYMMADHVLREDSLLFFDRNIYFPDSPGMSDYPFGNSVVIVLISRLLFLVPFDAVFNLYGVLLFSSISGYFGYLAIRDLRIKHFTSRLLLSVLTLFGFFFSLLSFGFSSQMVGLLFLLGFYDVLHETMNMQKIVVAGILLAAILFSYFYWVPPAILLLLLCFAKEIQVHEMVKSIRKGSKLLLAFIPTIILGIPFALVHIEGNTAQAAAADGTAYKVLALNFIIFVPFMLLWILLRKNFSVKNLTRIDIFVISGVVYTFILYILYRFDFLSSYSLAKSYPLTGTLLYAVSVAGIDRVSELIRGRAKYIISSSYLGILLFVFLMSPIQTNSQCLQAAPVPTFDMNTLGLDGRFMDMYGLHWRMLTDERIHRLNYDETLLEFFNKSSEYFEENGIEKVSVVADYDTALWFYAKTRVWPRSLPGESQKLFTPGYVSYQQWKENDESGFLVILNYDRNLSWIESNEFDRQSFDVIIQEGNNYLYEEKCPCNR